MTSFLKKIKNVCISAIAFVLRYCPFPGIERIARSIYYPGRSGDYLEVIARLPGGLRMRLRTSSLLEWRILFRGYSNFWITDFIRNTLRPGDVAFDIGANVGHITLVMAKRVGNEGAVFSFEPHPESRERMKHNIFLNGFRNVSVFSEAVSDSSGIHALHVPSRSSTNQGNAALGASGYSDLPSIVQVDTITIDDFILQHSIRRMRFLKIDTQGHDMSVLRGARNSISRFLPWISVCYSKRLWDVGDGAVSLEQFFSEAGYCMYYVKRRIIGRKLESLQKGDKPPDFCIIVAIPNKDIPFLASVSV